VKMRGAEMFQKIDFSSSRFCTAEIWQALGTLQYLAPFLAANQFGFRY